MLSEHDTASHHFPPMQSTPPLIAHVIQRLAMGGLENGVVNLLNHMPDERYRHAIICLADATDYANRIQRKDVSIYELHKRPGQDLGVHRRFYRLLGELRPAIVHTRNLPTLEFQVSAAAARVAGRVHGEHGRDMYDLDGDNFKYNALRKTMRLFIHRYIAVSQDLSHWLTGTLNVPPVRVSQIYNGVDMVKFHPPVQPPCGDIPATIRSAETFVIGTVGRMEAVKDQLNLVHAFLQLIAAEPALRQRLRLMLIGDGPLREQARQLLRSADAENLAWLPGARDDVPEVLRAMDLFVLPSLREGISNTILEAMACGRPVVATAVGGNPELVVEGVTGMLVPPADATALAAALKVYCTDLERCRTHGEAGRSRVLQSFSLSNMVDRYLAVYDGALAGRGDLAQLPNRTGVEKLSGSPAGGAL